MRAAGGLSQVHIRERNTGIGIACIAGGELGITRCIPAAGAHNLGLDTVVHENLEELPAPGLVIHAVGDGIAAEHHAAQGGILRFLEELGIVLGCLVVIRIQRGGGAEANSCHIVRVHRIGICGIERELRLEVPGIQQHLRATAQLQPAGGSKLDLQRHLAIHSQRLELLIAHHSILLPGFITPVAGDVLCRISQAIDKGAAARHAEFPGGHGALLVVIGTQVAFQRCHIQGEFHLGLGSRFHRELPCSIVNDLVLCIAEGILQLGIIGSSSAQGGGHHQTTQQEFHILSSGSRLK